MKKKLQFLTYEVRRKISSMSFGLALGLGAMVAGSGCAAAGQCTSCGACAAGIPLLAAPILIDGAIILVNKAKEGNQSEHRKSQK